MAVLALGGVLAARGHGAGWPAERWRRHRAGGAGLRADRHRRQRRRHLAAGAAGQARGRRARRAAAATIVWMMMIVGFAVTAGVGRQAARPVLAGAPGGGDARRCRSSRSCVTLLALWRLEGAGRVRRASPTPAPAQAGLSRGAGAGLGRAGGAPLHDLRLRLDAGLQRAGPDPRALCRRRVRLHAGRIDAAVRRAARRRAGSACCWRRWPAPRCRRGAGLAARLDDRRLPRLGAGAGRRWCAAGVVGPALAAARRRCSRSALANGAFADRRHRLDDGPGRRRPARRAKACAWACGARRRRSRFGLGGLVGAAASDLARWLIGDAGAGLCLGVRGRGAAVRALRRRCAWRAAAPRAVARDRRRGAEPPKPGRRQRASRPTHWSEVVA